MLVNIQFKLFFDRYNIIEEVRHVGRNMSLDLLSTNVSRPLSNIETSLNNHLSSKFDSQNLNIKESIQLLEKKKENSQSQLQIGLSLSDKSRQS